MLSAATPNGQGSIGVSASEIAQMLTVMQEGFTSLGDSAAVLTAAAIVGGNILTSGGSTAINLTTDTATNIINALTQSQEATPRIGQTFPVFLTNLNTATATVVAGSGVTLVGSGAVATSQTTSFLGTITGTPQLGGTPAISLQRMWSNGAAA